LFNNIATDLIGPVSYKIIDGIAYPVFLGILAFFFLGEVISSRTLAAALIALAGFGVYYADQFAYLQVNLPGLLAAIVTPFFFAISMIQIKWLLSHHFVPEKVVAVRFSLITLAALVWLPGHFPAMTSQSWLLVILIGSLGLALLFFILFTALTNIPATAMTVFSASTPLFSAVTAWLLIPGTTYQLNHYIGLTIIMVGLVSKVVEAEK
jgi:drug/metabolite transporter (DMT)-like permease